MRFAYADPPYPGQAARWYAGHPDYAGEVDHSALITQLERDYPDGWALSTSAAALQTVLALCPPMRVAIWHNTNSAPPGNRGTWHWAYEPVLIRGGRASRSTPVRDVLACGAPTGFAGQRYNGDTFPGRKPDRFARWLLDLLGYQDGDRIDDLFPGSGACGRVFADRAAQLTLDGTMA